MKDETKNLDPKLEFIFIASLKIALELIERGRDKEYYLSWCNEIWDEIQLHGVDKMNKVVQHKMNCDIKKILKL